LSLSVSAHGRAVDGNLERDARLRRIRFAPKRRLALAATYDVELVDTSGQAPLAAWRFATRDGAWGQPGVMAGSDLALTVDDLDNALLLFAPSRDVVHMTRYAPEERAWGEPEPFPRRAFAPVAKLDREGGLTLVWGETNSSWPSVWAASVGPGRELEPVELRAPDAPYSRLEAAALRGDGTGLVVWSDNPSNVGYRNRLLARPFGAAADGEPTFLARETGIQGARVAVEAGGGAWIVWHQTIPTGDTILAVYRSAAGSFGPTELLGIGTVGNPRVAVGGGRAIFLWTEHVRANRVTELRARVFDAERGWGTTESLDAIGELSQPTDYSDVAYPQIAMDEHGNALALWTTTDTFVTGMTESSTSYDHRTQVRVQRYDAANGWESGHVPLGSVAGSDEYRIPTDPCVAFDAYGNALVVWSEGRDPAVARAARFQFDSGWQEPATVAASWEGPSGPRLVLDAFGRGFAAWHARPASNADYEISVARFSEE
jgi:hypothetical protein